jgi:hypothetical protein
MLRLFSSLKLFAFFVNNKIKLFEKLPNGFSFLFNYFEIFFFFYLLIVSLWNALIFFSFIHYGEREWAREKIISTPPHDKYMYNSTTHTRKYIFSIFSSFIFERSENYRAYMNTLTQCNQHFISALSLSRELCENVSLIIIPGSQMAIYFLRPWQHFF